MGHRHATAHLPSDPGFLSLRPRVAAAIAALLGPGRCLRGFRVLEPPSHTLPMPHPPPTPGVVWAVVWVVVWCGNRMGYLFGGSKCFFPPLDSEGGGYLTVDGKSHPAACVRRGGGFLHLHPPHGRPPRRWPQSPPLLLPGWGGGLAYKWWSPGPHIKSRIFKSLPFQLFLRCAFSSQTFSKVWCRDRVSVHSPRFFYGCLGPGGCGGWGIFSPVGLRLPPLRQKISRTEIHILPRRRST